MPRFSIKHFLQMESSGGILLFLAAVLAIVLDNTSASGWYQSLLYSNIHLHLGVWSFHESLHLIINDGLMVIFFLLVGLEMKRELYEGELNTLKKVSLPAIAGFGGMLVPALIYLAVNALSGQYHGHTNLLNVRGWAIPTATDIAFALGILSLLGSRVPTSLKIFLTSLAIFDDLGGILIIALFYSESLNYYYLLATAVTSALLWGMTRFCVDRLSLYVAVGFLLWFCILKSGLHPTLTGVLLALAIPVKGKNSKGSPLKRFEKMLHPWVAFLILPLFAFANAGVSFSGVQLHELYHAVPLGIALGLFFGKQIGIFGAVWLAVKTNIAVLPSDATWRKIYGISLICGVGFTMSLFIGKLAFEDVASHVQYLMFVRIGVLLGSLVSGLLGYFVLRME